MSEFQFETDTIQNDLSRFLKVFFKTYRDYFYNTYCEMMVVHSFCLVEGYLTIVGRGHVGVVVVTIIVPTHTATHTTTLWASIVEQCTP